jgi:hypothetical protein
MDFLKGKEPQVISEEKPESKLVRPQVTKNKGEDSAKKNPGGIAPFNKNLFANEGEQLGLVKHTSHASNKRQSRKE